MIKKVLIVTLTFFLCLTSVNAFTKGTVYTHSMNSSEGSLSSGQAYYADSTATGSREYKGYRHYVTQSNTSTKFDAYCVDGWRVTSNQNVKIINDDSILKTNGKDLALLYMLNEGSYSYIQRLLAIRAFIPTGRFYSNTQNINTNKKDNDYVQIYANYRSGYFWLVNKSSDNITNYNNVLKLFASAEKSNASEAQALINSWNSNEKTFRTYMANLFKNHGFDVFNPNGVVSLPDSFGTSNKTNEKYRLNGSNSDVKKAKELFYKAIDYAANYETKTTAKAKITISNPQIDNSSLKVENNRQVGIINFNINFEHVAAAKNSITLMINPDGGKQRVLLDSKQYSTDNKTWNTLKDNTDFRTIIGTSDSKTVYIKIKVSSETNVGNIKLDFNTIVAYPKDAELQGALVTPMKNQTVSDNDKQRFLIGAKGGNPSYEPVSKDVKISWYSITPKCPKTIPTKPTKPVKSSSDTDVSYAVKVQQYNYDLSEYSYYLSKCCFKSDVNKSDGSISIEERCQDKESNACNIFNNDCKTSIDYRCAVVNKKYYDKTGKEVPSINDYYKSCFVCLIPGQKNQFNQTDNNYHGKDGRIVDESTYYLECAGATKCSYTSGKYFDIDGKIVSKDKYYSSCFSCLKPNQANKVGVSDSNYHGKDGRIVDVDTYYAECDIDDDRVCPSKIPARNSSNFDTYMNNCCRKADTDKLADGSKSVEQRCNEAIAEAKTESAKNSVKLNNVYCKNYYNYCVEKNYCATTIPNKSNTDSFKTWLKTCCKKSTTDSFSVEEACSKKYDNGKWCRFEDEYCNVCDGTKSVATQCSDLSTDKQTPSCEGNVDTVIKDNDNAKLCIVDYSDEADNPYKLTNTDNVTNNPYCNVYCKEDYKISLPLGRWVDPGRSFSMVTSISGSKTCYTDLINYDKFITDLNSVRANLKVGSNNNLETVKQYNSIINQYKVCAEASWDSSIKLDPEISVTYDESDYISKVTDKKIKFKKATNAVDSTGKKVNINLSNNNNVWLCNSTEVDDYYNVCKNSAATSNAGDILAKLNNQLTCDTKGNCQAGLNVAATRYAKKVSTSSAIYVPEKVFYTNSGSGIIEVSSKVSGSTWVPLATDIKDGTTTISDSGSLPVALKRKTGFYNFKINYGNLGEFFNSKNKYGRLIGDKNSVAQINKGTTFKSEYLCQYVVSCIACSTSCYNKPEDGFFCSGSTKYTIPGDPGGTEECRNCKVIYSQTDTNTNLPLYSPRVTSTENVIPDGRKAGYNFSTEKGRTVVSEIEKKGDTIYGEKPEFTVEITPSVNNKIREYNKLVDYTSMVNFDCKNYSATVKTSDPELIAKLKDNDYLVCDYSSTKASNGLVNILETIKENVTNNIKHKSWAESCPSGSVCNTSGVTGPAYK